MNSSWLSITRARALWFSSAALKMCGFAGIWWLDRTREVPVRSLEAMLAALRWRGGDGERVMDGRGFGCAFARLALQDLRPSAMPPFERERWTLVANGELWDFELQRLRFEAQGMHFATHSDQEVLAALVAEDRPLAPRARGMYALAAYDQRRHRLVLERDPWGQKPLFYAAIDGGIAFASTLPALLALPEVPRELDRLSVADALSYGFIPDGATPWRHLHRVMPGERIVFASSTTEPTRESYEPEPGGLLGELSTRLDKTVQRQWRTDRERALCLSGGIDSALLAAHAQRGAGQWKTVLSAHFSDGSDELSGAQQSAAALGLSVEAIAIDARAIEALPRLIEMAGEPCGDASLLSLVILARAARERGAAVIYTGDGADEWFFGYDRYRWMQAPLRARRTSALEVEADALEGARGLSRWRRAWQQRATSYPGLMRKISAPSMRQLFRDDALHAAWCERQLGRDAVFQTALAHCAGDAAAAAARYDRRYYLPNGPLAKSDLASHAARTESRAPFLDLDLIVAAPQHAGPWWQRGKQGLRRQAHALHLPRSVVRARKRGFRTPLHHWIQEVGGAAAWMAPHRAAFESVFSWAPLARWIAEQDAGTHDHATRLYHCFASAHFLALWNAR